MSTTSNGRKWARVLSRLLLLALVGYGGFLRVIDLDESLFGDEITTRAQAMQPVGAILDSGPHPLHALAAKLSLRAGDTETALRFPSLVAGLLSILVLYGLVRQLHSRTAGLVAAALLAFNPFHITQSNLALPYALLILCTLLTVWSLWLLVERGRWYHGLAFLAAAFLGIGTHASFIPALAALTIGAALYVTFQRSRGALKRRVGHAAAIFCCALLAGSLLVYHGMGPVPAARDLLSQRNASGEAAVAQTTEAAAEGESVALQWAGFATMAQAHAKRPRGGGAALPLADSGETRYVLTYYDCLAHLKRFFWTDTDWVWAGLLVVGVCGMFDLLYRVPALGFPLGFSFVLTPLSLFCFGAKQPYIPSEFSCGFVFALLFVGVGLCVLPRFVSRLLGAPQSLRLWRRVPETPSARTVTPANVLYVLLVIGLAIPAVPVVDGNYQTYPVAGPLPQGALRTNKLPEQDWKNLFREMARTLKKGDQIYFMAPPENNGPQYARYYLSQWLPWAAEKSNLGYHEGMPTEASLNALGNRYPMANLWAIGSVEHQVERILPFWHAAGATQINVWGRNRDHGLALFRLGAPTTNHVPNGSFEESKPDELPAGVSLDPNQAYHGVNALRIDGAEAGPDYFAMPVSPASYRLRNNGFDAWEDGAPVGWVMRAPTPEMVQPQDPGFEESISLRIAPADDAVILQQTIPIGLAPGRTLELQMMGHSNTPNNLHLVLRYAGPGYQEERHTVHPGTGKWVRMHMTEDLPADVNPATISVEIWRMPGGDGDVVVDKVELRVRDLGGALEPGQPYTLSLMARAENLPPASNGTPPPGRIRLRWVDDAGQTGHTDLIGLRRDSNWHFRTATFTPGVDIPTNMKALYVEAGMDQPTGALWLDQVQLETGVRPTPFTETFRLPHDEALATLDISAYEAPPSW